ncbi:MAG: transcriptional regulator [Rhodobacteraceae bacterium]|nr:MAG: transcriptional regulator [Paracoccaceae bacterium]
MTTDTKQPTPERRSSGIQVIARAADVLRALKKENTGLSLSEISDRVALPRSTIQRIVNALIKEGLVMSAGASSGYRLGPELQSLALAGRIEVAETLRPTLNALSQKTGETVDLAVVRSGKVIFVDQVVGSHRLRTVSGIGEVFPMTTTANGKAAMSFLNKNQIEKVIAREIGTDENAANKLRGELRDLQDGGLASDINQHSDGISALGFAFKTLSGLIYAISIPVPSYRFESIAPKLEELLLQTRIDIKDIVL